MSLYLIEVIVKSPIQIADLVIGNVFKQTKCLYIQSNTIKGSILSKFYIEYNINDVIEESNNPSINFHPLYPMLNGYTSRSAHLLLHQCKLCNVKIESDKDTNIFVNDVLINKELLSKFRFEDFHIPSKCPNGHLFAITPVKGLVIFKDKIYKKIDIDFVQLESIGITRGIGRVEVGMLYSYIGVKPGVKYLGLVYDHYDKIKDWFGGTPKNGVYRIGRGISRGMGLIEVKFNMLDYKDYIDKRSRDIEDAILKTNGIVILRALSPILKMNGSEFSYKIDLDNIGLKPMNIHEDLNYLSASSEILKGYSVYTNLPKLSIKGLGAGTLYFYKVMDGIDIELLSKNLAELEVKGFAEPYNVGLNIMEVYTDVKYLLWICNA